MFIGLAFVAYFLFEVLGGLRVHPLQYLLVGFGNAIFYLLLLGQTAVKATAGRRIRLPRRRSR